MDRIGDYFANAETAIAEDVGHFVHFETPEAANQRIIDFFRKCCLVELVCVTDRRDGVE